MYKNLLPIIHGYNTFILGLLLIFSQITLLYRFGIYLIANLFISFINLFVVLTVGILILGPVNNKILVKNNQL